MEAEYNQYSLSDSSDEEGDKLNDEGKELKKLIKTGAPEYVPKASTNSSENKKQKKATNVTSESEIQVQNAVSVF